MKIRNLMILIAVLTLIFKLRGRFEIVTPEALADSISLKQEHTSILSNAITLAQSSEVDTRPKKIKPLVSTEETFEFNYKPLTKEQIYCWLDKQQVDLPMSGEIKMTNVNYDSDENGRAGFIAMIQSDACPQSTFSTVRVTRDGRIENLIDCRSTSAEEVGLRSGVQGDVKFTGVGTDLAISGPGYFLIECFDQEHLSRAGKMKINKDGLYEIDGCRVLSNERKPIEARNELLDEHGCFANGECVAVVTPEKPEAVAITGHSRLFMLDSDSLKPAADSKIFSGYSEELDDPSSGPLGPDWDKLKLFDRPNCADVDVPRL